jgi:hypothetical protein
MSLDKIGQVGENKFYVLLMIYLYARRVELKYLKNIKSLKVYQSFDEQRLCQYFLPFEVLTDNRADINGKL